MNSPRSLGLIVGSFFLLVLWRSPVALAEAVRVTLAPPVADKTPMLVQADEIKYNYLHRILSGVGHVQIKYGGATIEADRAVYHQRSERLRAQGSAMLTEQNGRITHARIILIHWARRHDRMR
jgi:lipopolysaccharide assembly outer membrane protein LptD (OstA)